MNFIERNAQNDEWIFILGIVILCFWVAAKLLNDERFQNFLSFFVNEKYTQDRIRENNWFGITEFILLCSGLICLSFLAFEVAYAKTFIAEKNLTQFLKVTFFISIFFIAKNLLLKITFFFFDIGNYFKWYWFYKLVGFIWLTNLLFIFYLWKLTVFNSTYIITILVLFLGIIIYSILVLKLFKKYSQLIINQFLYFILYICTLEIAPYAFAYKIIDAMQL